MKTALFVIMLVWCIFATMALYTGDAEHITLEDVLNGRPHLKNRIRLNVELERRR